MVGMPCAKFSWLRSRDGPAAAKHLPWQCLHRPKHLLGCLLGVLMGNLPAKALEGQMLGFMEAAEADRR